MPFDPLSVTRTKLANQRTYMSYLTAGFSIAAVAGSFKKLYLVAFGVLMILVSTVQFVRINNALNRNEDPDQQWIESLSLVYAVMGLMVLYLQYKK